ncbi:MULTISPECIES: D-aminoacyl-tRNA deacylase [Halomonas]|uniref:D-aminoacyl-tRNA deacylase n=2 Tax=Halomonas TaxID=2745 RepID=A0AAU7KUN6_9GAMM|nr:MULTISPECIES: D-aminoacyl-tRNA deacylase [Halomonas]MBR9773164.1 D-tyrosyl-tRNA(Tyr) deacylase [Gammaproteobacteria bacterium]KJZ08788.1 D-tyrosyl-tRNA(Tyr) deacylase [Halomonas sp. S2151]MBR9880035.1 D-tyrosyl-tRNA(Tyr) deacylase [Gammaproteobacteria bacterium]MBS8267676.1 D-tyrosyl-tRNA(Tyr) deacylase [Halomonas litopenaei]MBY5939511.1 D-tyrosyl-tRNA(Tyr) deacylase [Halomonas sp. DP5N14-9]|tara:strand:+ start:670 stop:1107 length:438 start_codon:yes stop_codon:yes gene_type:complete
MKALIQRVRRASVEVEDRTVGAIDHGLLALVGVEKGDDEASADRLLHKLLHYRVFADDQDKMNLNVQQAGGGLLLVSQFTLAADTRKGLRPSFSSAAPPAEGDRLFHYLLDQARQRHAPVASGEFGANMQVALINDGPVTFLLES